MTLESSPPPDPALIDPSASIDRSEQGGGDDPLASFDTILAQIAEREVETDARSAHRIDANKKFLAAFAEACEREVRPAMEAVIARLRSGGGGGSIEQHPGGEARFLNASLIAWMSLEGEIVGEPRPDREPYLQIEADVDAHEVPVFEGDMWRGGGGGRSGRVATWQLSDLTNAGIIAELLEIARRSAQ
jgi:hypothetical protein